MEINVNSIINNLFNIEIPTANLIINLLNEGYLINSRKENKLQWSILLQEIFKFIKYINDENITQSQKDKLMYKYNRFLNI